MPLQLTIVTPEGEAFSGEVDQVVLPGTEGDFGVLEEHERFLSPLKHGALEIIHGGTSDYAAVSQGFAEVSSTSVVVLADYCELAHEIDVALAREEHDEAVAALGSLAEGEREEERRAQYETARVWAAARIEVAERHA